MLAMTCVYRAPPGGGTLTFLFLSYHFKFLIWAFTHSINVNVLIKTLYLNHVTPQKKLLYYISMCFVLIIWRQTINVIAFTQEITNRTTSPASCRSVPFLSIQVSRILYSFSTAFRRSSRPADISHAAPSSRPDSDLYTFTVTLEIKEDDGKGNYR